MIAVLQPPQPTSPRADEHSRPIPSQGEFSTYEESPPASHDPRRALRRLGACFRIPRKRSAQEEAAPQADPHAVSPSNSNAAPPTGFHAWAVRLLRLEYVVVSRALRRTGWRRRQHAVRRGAQVRFRPAWPVAAMGEWLPRVVLTGAPGHGDPRQHARYMPSKSLVEHEWATHGTCSALTPEAYFLKARTAFRQVTVPPAYEQPTTAFRTSVSRLEHDWVAENEAVGPASIAVQCRGKFLQEVRVCLDKDLQPRPCGRDLKDACRGSFLVRPVR